MKDKRKLYFSKSLDLSPEKIAEISDEKLRMVGLPDIPDLKPAELSGGMKKRVGLARAIAMDHSYVLYDETTTGLDQGISNSQEV